MEQKFRIKLKSYDSTLLEISTKKIVKVLKHTKAIIGGPIPLPSKKEKFTVLRSPHVYKKSRERFVYPTYRRIIDVYTSDSSAIDALTKLELSSSVAVEICS